MRRRCHFEIIKNHSTLSFTNMEPITCNESMAKKEGERLDKRCSISVHSRTKRLSDADGRSVKALIDGLREAGILEDDNPKFVKKVEQSQEITTDEEETIIDILWEE
jgi:transposase